MKLFEMEGFLRGKCLPGDMKVNETNAEYLVRKFAEAESKCAALAAENAYLIPKAASELSNAWVLHKYLIGIQAAIMYLDNGNKKAAQEWLYGTIAGPGFEFPDEVEDIDAWATHQMRGSISHPQAIEIIKAETPATDAFLTEVRASAIPEGYVLVPQQIFLDPSDIESICSQCGDGHESGYGEFTDGLLWVGNIQRDDGSIVHGLHISSADYSEDGGVTVCEFAAQLRQGGAV